MAAVAFFPFQFVDIPQVACAFTSRRGGVSEPPHDSANISFDVNDDPEAVAVNRRAVFERMGLTGWCELNQVHGDVIHFDPAPRAPEERHRGPALLAGPGRDRPAAPGRRAVAAWLPRVVPPLPSGFPRRNGPGLRRL